MGLDQWRNIYENICAIESINMLHNFSVKQNVLTFLSPEQLGCTCNKESISMLQDLFMNMNIGSCMQDLEIINKKLLRNESAEFNFLIRNALCKLCNVFYHKEEKCSQELSLLSKVACNLLRAPETLCLWNPTTIGTHKKMFLITTTNSLLVWSCYYHVHILLLLMSYHY